MTKEKAIIDMVLTWLDTNMDDTTRIQMRIVLI
jgi:hypothetical protein